MATSNKRQQVRNERALQELIKTVPGNDRCADCATRNPGWASWSLGIFLCIRCAALHRKLGTHISKVKSLSMDSWTNDQVENMKRIGNVNSNHTYNSRNTKPSIPIDADEIEGVMERFIRQKYEHRAFAVDSAPGSRQNTGSTSSDDRPPPLPPKPSKRFHFPSLRAASSTFPVRSNTLSPPTSPGLSGFGREPSPPPKDKKPAKFLGAEVGASRDDGSETKMAHLRDMGFSDERRNMQVLRGLDGNVEKSLETLMRLGEGSKSALRTRSPFPPSPLADIGFTNGITVDKTRTTPRGDKSNNPFDINVHKSLPPPPVQGQTGARGAFLERTVSPAISSNPFLPSGQQVQQSALDQSFQNMQISQQQQQQPQSFQNSKQFPQSQQPAANQLLFPNTTGGYNVSQPQTNPFLQTYTPPPMPQMPTQYQQFTQPSPFQPLQQQSGHNQQQTPGQANPFLRTSRSQVFRPSNSFDQSSPFGVDHQNSVQNLAQQPFQQPLQMAASQPNDSNNPFQAQQSQQSHQQQYQPVHNSSPFQQGSSSSPLHQPQNSSPFQSMNVSQPNQQVVYQEPQALQHSNTVPHLASPVSAPPQQQQLFQAASFSPPPQQQHQATYPPAQQDKKSILALYNYPQSTSPLTSMDGTHRSGQVQANATVHGQKRSVTMPVSSMTSGGTMNPFAPGGTTNRSIVGGSNIDGLHGMSKGMSPAPANGYRHASNESVQFGADMMMNGRHSPDAFAGLSARLR